MPTGGDLIVDKYSAISAIILNNNLFSVPVLKLRAHYDLHTKYFKVII